MAINRHVGGSYRLQHGDSGNPSVTVGTDGNDRFAGASAGFGYVAYGDSYELDGTAQGGSDRFVAGAFVVPESTGSGQAGAGHFFVGGAVFAGDAVDMWGLSHGGNDTFSAGLNSSVEFAGDALGTMGDAAAGGNDLIALGATDAQGVSLTSFNIAYGDAYSMVDGSTGGSDTISAGRVSASGDGYATAFNVAAGDGYAMGGYAMGGADVLKGANTFARDGQAFGFNILAGDALVGGESATFGNDVLAGGSASGDGYSITFNMMSGDVAQYNTGSMHFGDDVLNGGAGSGNGIVLNVMFGDMGSTGSSIIVNPTGMTALLAEHAPSPYEAQGVLAAEALIGSLSHSADSLVVELPPGAVYGNDTLTAGATRSFNEMVGDTQTLSDGERGGDDLLAAGGASTQNMLIGDAIVMAAGSLGGNDVLVSGAGNDEMWGDAQSNSGTGGADLFVFKPSNGMDVIHDFQAGVDHISLKGFHSTNLPQSFAELLASGRIEQAGSDVIIDLSPVHVAGGGGEPGPLAMPGGTEVDTVTLVGVNLDDLSPDDFIF